MKDHPSVVTGWSLVGVRSDIVVQNVLEILLARARGSHMRPKTCHMSVIYSV